MNSLIALPLVALLAAPIVWRIVKDQRNYKQQQAEHPLPDVTAEQLHEALVAVRHRSSVLDSVSPSFDDVEQEVA